MRSELPDPIDVRRYDLIVAALLDDPASQFAEVARQFGVTETTVRKIWEGTISRPPVVVLERLPKPRRCPHCGGLCREWPCILCEMKRRAEDPQQLFDERRVRFKYRAQGK